MHPSQRTRATVVEERTARPHAGEPVELLDVRHLGVSYNVGRRRAPVCAVDGVSFRIGPCETLGLVGESGSGKTTIARAILGLAPISQGTITFSGRDITNASYKERRQLSSDLQAVFQDPYSSLNPSRTVRQTLGETLRGSRHEIGGAGLAERVEEMLERVGLQPDAGRRYPGHFSGGQRQRIAIARALMGSPRLVICDEPTSALDLSVQAQVLNLLRTLQHDLKLSYLFISHDLAVVRHLSSQIIVLYRGRVMEQGSASTLYTKPAHPYTRALLEAAPVPDPVRQRQRRLARAVRSVEVSQTQPDSCPFAPRCPHAIDVCTTDAPRLEVIPSGSLVACHRWAELSA